MKRIEHYCSAVDQIKHEPKRIEEVLAMKQEKKQIKMTKSGRAVGAAVAAALVCANVGGGYWLLHRGAGSELTTQVASAPVAASVPDTVPELDAETAAKEARTQAEISNIETNPLLAKEKPKAACSFIGLTETDLAEMSEVLDQAGVSAEDQAKMLEALKYYAENAVLKKNGIAVDPADAITDPFGFSVELNPDAEKDAPANCELSVNATLWIPDESADVLILKDHAYSQTILLTNGDPATLPLEIQSGSLDEAYAAGIESGKDLNLQITVGYRPRVCENEADEIEFQQTYCFTLSPEQLPVPEEETQPPVEMTAAEESDATSAAETTGSDEKPIIAEAVSPQQFITYDTDNDPNYDPDIIKTDAEWYELEKYYDGECGVNGINNLKETEKVLTHYAKNAVLKQNGKVLKGEFQKLSNLDGLTFEILPDEDEKAYADCGMVIKVILYTDKDEAWESRRQLKLSTGEFADYWMLETGTDCNKEFKPLIGDPVTEKINTLEEASGCRVDVEVTYIPYVNQAPDDNSQFTYIYTFKLK